MARIPGPSDVRSTQAQRPIPLRDAGASGRVFQQLGDIANQLYERRRKAEDAGYMANLASNAEPEFTRIFEENKLKAQESGEDFVLGLNQELDKASNNILDSAKKQGFRPSSEARQQAQLRLANLKSNFLTRGVVYENNIRVDKLSREVDTAIDNYASLTFDDPNTFNSRLSEVNELINESTGLIHQDELSSKREIAARKLARSAIESYIESNPEKAVNILNDENHLITKSLDVEDLEQLQPQATQADRIEKAYALGRNAVNASKNLGEVYEKIEKIEDRKLREQSRSVAEDFYRQRIAVENEKNSGKEALKAVANREAKDYLDGLKLGYQYSEEERKRVFDLAESAGVLDKLLADEDRERDLWLMAIQPRKEQDNIIEALSKSKTVEGARRYSRAIQKRDEIEEKAKDDGYTLGVRQGLIVETPLDLKNPESFAVRSEQAERLSAHYGVRVSPLSDREVTNLVDSLPELTINEKFAMANRINSMGPNSSRVWEKLSKKNALIFAYSGAISDKAPAISRSVLEGEDLIKRGNVIPIKMEDYLQDFDNYVNDVYSGKDRQAVRQAAVAAYASTYGNEYTPNNFEDILEQVTGGVIEINGQHLELPRNINESQFERYVDRFTEEAVQEFGGVINATDERAAEMIRESKWINADAEGQYYVVHPVYGQLHNKENKVLILEYRSHLVGSSFRGRTRSNR